MSKAHFSATLGLIVILSSHIAAIPAWGQLAPKPEAEIPIESLVKTAKTKADHQHIADILDAEARTEADKAKALQDQSAAYQQHKHGYYGKNISDLKEHAEALAQHYQQAAQRHQALAAIHRQIANEIK